MSDSLPNAQDNAGHLWMRAAALLGACFLVLHMVTVIVTCSVDGFHWGVNAWILDLAGILAALFFAIQCWISSGTKSNEFQSGNQWIFIWAAITFIVRIVDSLMLFGVVKWHAIYITPAGVVLWSNIVSEVVFGMAFTVAALVGSFMLLRSRGTRSSASEFDSHSI